MPSTGGPPFATRFRRSRARWFILAAVACGVLGGVVAFGPLVRARAIREAAARGLDMQIGSVQPGFFWLGLRDVSVRPSGVGTVRLTLPEVRVGLRVSLAIQEIDVSGGELLLSGSRQALEEDVRRWRAERPAKSGAGGSGGMRLKGEDISATWVDPAGELSVLAKGIGFSRDETGTKITVREGAFKQGSLGFEAGSAEVVIEPSGALRSATLDTAAVSLEVHEAAAKVTAPVAAGDAPPPPPPSIEKRKGQPPLPVATTDASTPLVALPQLHLLRASVANLAETLASRLPDGGFLQINGLSLTLQKGGERLSLGPGPLIVRRNSERVSVDFSTSATANGTPLSLRAEIPTDSHDVEVSLAGGPVSFSLLGVKEGSAGLTDVDRATVAGKGRVVLEAHGESLTFDAELRVRGMAIRQPRLAADTLRGLDFGVSARGVLSDKGELRLDDADAALGALRLALHGGLEQTTDHVAASLDFEVPVASCQALLESVPTALLPTVSAARMAGTLGGKGRLAFDTRRLDDLVLDYEISDHCHMVEVPDELSRERFSKEFAHRVYLKDGSVSDETTGPGSRNWTDLDHISPFMQAAVLTTEDGAFFHHHGFNHAAIRGALIANLKARRFVRGASTITMQLAKNLFLTREKTLGRKLEELILTDYLEQVFTKDEMMELYLNIIEFGPDLYGVTAAAEHYFGRTPEELNLAEALFLSSILPSPLRYHALWEKGAVSDSWMRGLHERMEIAGRTGKVSPPQLAEGLTESIVFWHPDMPRPAPRELPTTEKRDYDAAQWEQTN